MRSRTALRSRVALRVRGARGVFDVTLSAAVVALVVVAVVASVCGGLPAGGASPRPVDRLVRALTDRGLLLGASERACVAASTAATATTAGGSVLDVVLGCVAQDHAVAYVVGRWAATAGASDADVACLARRLRVATWPEVSESMRAAIADDPSTAAFVGSAPDRTVSTARSAASALSPTGAVVRGAVSNRVAPYATSCAGASPTTAPSAKLPLISLAQVTGRWNDAVARHTSPFVAITALTVLTTPPSSGAASSPTGVKTSAALVGAATTLGINTNADGVTGLYLGLHGGLATPEVTTTALELLAEVVEGRDRAPTLVRSLDVPARFARFDKRTIYIGHAAYTVRVDKDPLGVLIVVTW